MNQPDRLTPAEVARLSAEARDAWLSCRPGDRYARYTGKRTIVRREMVEARLALHGQILDALLANVMQHADAQTAAAIAVVQGWVQADHVRIIRDLFELFSYAGIVDPAAVRHRQERRRLRGGRPSRVRRPPNQ